MKFKLFDESNSQYVADLLFESDDLGRKRPKVICKVEKITEIEDAYLYKVVHQKLSSGTVMLSLRTDGIFRVVKEDRLRLVADGDDSMQYLESAKLNPIVQKTSISIEELLEQNKMRDAFMELEGNTELSEYESGRRYVVIDVETTGLNPFDGDRIIQYAAIDITEIAKSGGDGNFQANGRGSTINPERPIPAEATKIHGIKDDDVKDSPAFKEHAKELAEFIGDAVVVGHNVSFDLSFINAEMIRAGLEPLNNDSYCTLQNSRILLREKGYNGPFSLVALRKLLDINTGSAHDAEADAKATIHLFNILIRLDSLAQQNIKTLRQAQRNNDELASSNTPLIILMLLIASGFFWAITYFLGK